MTDRLCNEVLCCTVQLELDKNVNKPAAQANQWLITPPAQKKKKADVDTLGENR